MKKIITGALLAGALFSGAASAATYALNSGANNNSLWNITGVKVNTWNATLTVNATGNSFLSGSLAASNGRSYTINVTLTDAYTSGTLQKWGNFSGTVVGGGVTTSLNDIGSGRDSMDAAFGVNAAPYNTNTALLEFGFWSDTSATSSTAPHNFDLNTTVTCTSGTPTANGSCASSTSSTTSSTTSSGGSVPVPGTLALAALGLVGIASRKFARKA